MKIKKMLGLALSLIFLVSGVTACSQSTESLPPGSASLQPTGESGQERIKLTWMCYATDAGKQKTADIIALLAEEGYDVELISVPDSGDGNASKILISLMAGDPVDILGSAASNLKPFYNAGVLEDLGLLTEQANYDMESVYGDYLVKFDGTTVALPACVDVACTLYNKEIFDKANVPYPNATDWTWEKYIETARQLTNTDQDIYGSFMPDWTHYNYMYALQKGAEHYKAGGESNYDDDLFRESVEFNDNLMNGLKIQPDYLTIRSRQLPGDYFMSGRIGMTVVGGWMASCLADQTAYPRDWEAGILPMPYPEGFEPSVSTVIYGYSIPKTSVNKEAAFDAIRIIAENQYKLGYGEVPARIDLTESELDEYIAVGLMDAFKNDPGITVEDIKNCWFDSHRRVFAEKVIGPGDVDINNAFIDECSLYYVREQDLDTTMKNIKQRADQAIQNENEDQ